MKIEVEIHMKAESIIRIKKDKDDPYVRMNKDLLTNKRLSYAARGLMAYLLSKPDDWETKLSDLIKQSPAGITVVRRLIKELRTAGYIERERMKDPVTGKFIWTTVIYEAKMLNPRFSQGKPSTGFLSMENPPIGNLSIENRPLINNDSVTTDIPKIDQKSRRSKKSIEHYVISPAHPIALILARVCLLDSDDLTRWDRDDLIAAEEYFLRGYPKQSEAKDWAFFDRMLTEQAEMLMKGWSIDNRQAPEPKWFKRNHERYRVAKGRTGKEQKPPGLRSGASA